MLSSISICVSTVQCLYLVEINIKHFHVNIGKNKQSHKMVHDEQTTA